MYEHRPSTTFIHHRRSRQDRGRKALLYVYFLVLPMRSPSSTLMYFLWLKVPRAVRCQSDSVVTLLLASPTHAPPALNDMLPRSGPIDFSCSHRCRLVEGGTASEVCPAWGRSKDPT
ncbi:hypothetical protein GY45DRAFT_74090 [Cubamyces sp. BRFM 1775]|nr:hypothetical protein GY45DRAFT_74090 [Cubamyces sp. BRFM 1775]